MESQISQPLGGSQTSTRRLQTAHHPTHPGFHIRKQQILNSLVDSRPGRVSKGHSSIDEPILPLVEILNKHEDYVTVSSCSGRVSIYSISDNGSLSGGNSNARRLSGNNSTIGNEFENVHLHRNQDDDLGVDELLGDSSSIKFGKGKLLFVTHSQIDLPKERGDEVVKEFLLNKIFGIGPDDVMLSTTDAKDNFDSLGTNEYRLVYYKFEPMVCELS